MLKTSLVCVVLFAAACGKKAEEKKPEPTEKIVEKQPGKEPTAALTRMTLTTKSAEAKAAFEKAQDLAYNQHGEEAKAEYKKAVELDPEFALAVAALGGFTPGAEGTDLIAKAGPLAAKATDAEKAQIDAMQAMRAGDPVKAKASFEKVLQLAPGQWEADAQLAYMATGRGDTEDAIKHFEHAITIKPDLPQAQNGLAYAYAQKKDWDKAIGAAKKQVELLPKEPNPLDTLAEIELMANKLDDAEKDFTKATEIDPKFTIAWQGVGLARAYKGDFKGAYEAFDKRAASTAPGEKFEVAIDKAWLQYSEDKLADATATLDAAEKDAELKKYPLYTFYAADRAWMLMQSGKYADAAKWNATMLTRINDLAGDAKLNAMTRYRIQQLRLAALQGKPAADADKLIADATEDAKRLGDNKFGDGVLAYMRGLAAWAKGGAKDGPKAAIAEMSKCDEAQLICRFDLAAVTRKSGDAAGAEAIEKAYNAKPDRSPQGVYAKTHPSK
jgi:tetratricopeptide (TPR) repeat protein